VANLLACRAAFVEPPARARSFHRGGSTSPTAPRIKVVLVARRMPERRLATLASTLVPPALVEGAFTALLVVDLLAAGLVSLNALTPILPPAGTVLAIAVAVCVGLATALIFRRRLKQLVRDVRSGLAVLSRPRIMATRIVLARRRAGSAVARLRAGSDRGGSAVRARLRRSR